MLCPLVAVSKNVDVSSIIEKSLKLMITYGRPQGLEEFRDVQVGRGLACQVFRPSFERNELMASNLDLKKKQLR